MQTLLVTLVLTLLTTEDPSISERPSFQRWQVSVMDLAGAIAEVSQHGRLVNPEVDAAILAATAYRESRWRTWVAGDCVRKRCKAFGAMQLTKGWFRWGYDLLQLSRTTDSPDDARVQVEIAYRVLEHRKRECGGGPLTWFASYRISGCPKRKQIDFEARKRCKLAERFHRKLSKDNWQCRR
jgi:hypothetical protein